MPILPSKEDFLRDARKGIIRPLCLREEKPGFDPAAAYRAIRGGEYSFLLESARVDEKTGRYSFLGADPYMIFKSTGESVDIIRDGRRATLVRPPLPKLRELMENYRVLPEPGYPPFIGGCIGFFSYDFVHNFEKLPRISHDDLGIPDAFFIFIDSLIAYDHIEKTSFIMANPGASDRKLGYSEPEDGDWPILYDKAAEKILKLSEKISGISKNERISGPTAAGIKAEPLIPKEDYERMVLRAKGYIAAGDIFQANLSQRLSADVTGIDAFDIYSVLRDVNPSPFACYLDFPGVKIVSSSPERLVRVSGRTVDTRPIAGTRPRGKGVPGDAAMRAELLLNEKERAEHIMLIDLERNDLGRVCDFGSVRVDELMVTEDYSHVIHIVSNVTGRLAEGKDAFDVIRAAFPGGTITGVPKVRCMEIIDELEPVARGPYTGSVGYISYNGDMDLNIVIRTFVIKDDKAYVQVGAGIVADSDPEREYYETLHKAEALIKTLEKL